MFDFTRFTTLDDISDELDLIGAAYTRKFIDAELVARFPGRGLHAPARALALTFKPQVLLIYPEYDGADSIKDADENAVSTSTSYQLGPSVSDQDFYDMRTAASNYILTVINPELRPAVRRWRANHPEELIAQ